MSKTEFDICVVGGAGHVGLPLAIAFAKKGQRVLIYDLNEKTMEVIKSGKMPFMEVGAEPLLKEVLAQGLLGFSSKPESVAKAKTLVVTIGTPVDEFLNPSLRLIYGCFETLRPHMNDDQMVVLRSTVYPGVTELVGKLLKEEGVNCKVAFCPERIVQGYAIEELKSLPQLVSGITKEAEDMAAELFALIAPEVVRVKTIEAEFAKLFSNAYRYIQFAVTNQFYMICNSSGVDYQKVLGAMKHNYPRMHGVPGPGLAAGPCLFKDTMQLSAYYENHFTLGLHAMLVNEGLPLYLLGQLKAKHDVTKLTVGLLGMAFKAESDDRRSSLSYKVKKVVASQAKKVLTTDPFVTDDPEIRPLDEVIAKSDVLVLCTPHKTYKNLDLKGKIVVDVWNFWNQEKSH